MEITFNQNGLIATQLRTHAPQKVAATGKPWERSLAHLEEIHRTSLHDISPKAKTKLRGLDTNQPAQTEPCILPPKP
jgi:hypothetical protein